MPSARNTVEDQDDQYSEALLKEGGYWDNFIANRLLEHDEIPGSVDFRIFFTQYSYKHNWGPPCLGPIAINFREREIRYILTHAASVQGARVLDLGCGAGWLSLELARQGAHVTAVDISPTNLALGRYMVENNARHSPFLYQKFAGFPCRLEEFGSVEHVYGDLNMITLPAREYDAVVVWDSLHHVRDIERLLEQIRTALKPDGIFIGVDHAFATPLTINFNDALVPWLQDINSWLALKHPTWLYKGTNAIARKFDWGVLGVDYDIGPIPNFPEFEAEVRNEMLSIISTGIQQERQKQSNSRVTQEEPTISEEPSPFEDISANKLMQVLIDRFTAEHFRTICPLIMPERHFQPPRNEAERIFQHYLSASLVEISERAVKRGQADGQWFVFQMTPQEPGPNNVGGDLSRIRDCRSVEEIAKTPMLERVEDTSGSEGIADSEQSLLSDQLLSELNQINAVLGETQAYGTYLEAELARKNDALSKLEGRVKQLEADVIKSRKPRLPWKRS